MVTKLIRLLKYYSLIPFLAIGFLLYLCCPFLIKLLCLITQTDNHGFFYNLFKVTVPILLLAVWIFSYASYLRSKRYRSITHRNLRKDMRYKRSYAELVEYFRDADPYQINPESLPKNHWSSSEGIILGKTKDNRLFHVPSGKDGKNYFLFGMPGSGKTAGPIICSCLRYGMNHELSEKNTSTFGSVFCIDLKNDIWKATHKYRSIRRFNLMDPENSCHFNPFSGIEKMSIDERCNFIENIGFNMIPEGSGSNGKYFSDTARDFWSGIALYMLHDNINTSFPDVIRTILSGSPIEWIKKVVAGNCTEAKQRLASKYGENEKNLSGGYSILAQSARKFASKKLFLLLGNSPEYEYISTQTLEDGYDCYIQLDQSEMANYSALISMIVQQFLTGFLTRDSNPHAGRLPDGTLRPCLMCLDEFPQLTALRYETVATSFMTLRSRNVSIICALQSKSSLAEMFHSENAALSLIDCVTTFCFLSIQEVTTREWASKLIGSKKVLKISNNLNNTSIGTSTSGQSVQEAMEQIIRPEEFGNLVDRDHGKDEIIIYSQGHYIRLDKQYYFN